MSTPPALFLSLLNLLTAQELDTELGSILGIQQSNYYEFRGIPFTQEPPTGSNRFRQSTVRTDSYTNDSIYDATFFRPECIQPFDENSDTEYSEDWYVLIYRQYFIVIEF